MRGDGGQITRASMAALRVLAFSLSLTGPESLCSDVTSSD